MGRFLVSLAISAMLLGGCESLLPLPPANEVQYPVGPYLAIGSGLPVAVPAEAGAEARKVALAHFEVNEPIDGIEIVDEALVPGFKRLLKADGSLTSSGDEGQDAWIFAFRAPPQDGWARVEGFVIVSTEGQVLGSSALRTTEP